MPMSYELTLHCCFCGKPIAEKPRVITVETDGGGEQRLFAHAACFRERLDPSVPFGESGAVGVDIKRRTSGWTMRRVIVIGLLWVLVLLIPVAVILVVNRR
jgi:hypothetical protein